MAQREEKALPHVTAVLSCLQASSSSSSSEEEEEEEEEDGVHLRHLLLSECDGGPPLSPSNIGRPWSGRKEGRLVGGWVGGRSNPNVN